MPSTRDRLITATNESFRRRGFHGTSMQSVVTSADATIGSLYHFFPAGKTELAEATVRETGRAYGELIGMFLADGRSVGAAIGAFFDGAAEVLVETEFLDVCPIGTVAREIAGEHEGIRAAAAEVFRQWADILVTALAANGVDPDDARAASVMVICLFEGAVLLARTARDPEVMRTAGRSAAGLVDHVVPAATTRP
ncbi:MAG: TetR/AcrR family transcriptional regulator [Ilumatobacteraceae bacterium]